LLLDQGVGVHVRLADLALGPILAQEPAVAQRLRVAPSRDPDYLGCFLLEAVELSRPNLQSRSRLEHGSCLPWLSSAQLSRAGGWHPSVLSRRAPARKY